MNILYILKKKLRNSYEILRFYVLVLLFFFIRGGRGEVDIMIKYKMMKKN